MGRRVVIAWLLSSASLLGGCSTSDQLMEAMKGPTHAIVDHLPEWAGGPPEGLPPKPGDPAYAAFKRRIEAKEALVPTAEQATLSPLH